MTDGYEPFLEGEQSALLASLISSGLERRYVEAATGLPYGVERHRYASCVHSVSGEDLDRLREMVSERAASDPDLWSEHAERCVSRGDRLVATARSLAGLAKRNLSPAELATGFQAFAEASMETAPFLLVTPVVRKELESLIEQGIASEAPDEASGEQAAQGLRQMLARAGEPEGIQETREFYRLVLTVMEDDEAVKLLRSTSPAIAAERIRTDFPGLYGLMRDHASAYGWLRARGHRSAPQSPKELTERMQAVVLRWTPETVREAAQPDPAPDPEAVLGFSPSQPLARLVGSLRQLAALPCSRIGLHRRAGSIAAPFFDALAAALSPQQGLSGKAEQATGTEETGGTEWMLFASADEIEAALGQPGTEDTFPAAKAGRRLHSSFTVERTFENLQVREEPAGRPHPASADGDEAALAAVLTGMTAARGRATGRVRVILAAPQVHQLGVGEILVTATSTPDAIGGESVFPTRAGPAGGIAQAAAIVTDEGGFLSHAAIVAREHGIPCIVGTERATSALTDGQVVEVDATQAVGRIVPLEP